MSANANELLVSVDALPDDQLQVFTEEVLRRNASRRSPSLSTTETQLLKEINEPLPADRIARYRELEGRRRAETLISDEHRELCDLSDWLEERNAERLTRVATLARLRGVALADMMSQLGLESEANSHRGLHDN
jgi:hypothetical protein